MTLTALAAYERDAENLQLTASDAQAVANRAGRVVWLARHRVFGMYDMILDSDLDRFDSHTHELVFTVWPKREVFI